MTQEELTNKQLLIRQGLDQTVESLKPQLSVADSERVEQQLVEVHHQWQKLEETMETRKKGNLRGKMAELCHSCSTQISIVKLVPLLIATVVN